MHVILVSVTVSYAMLKLVIEYSCLWLNQYKHNHHNLVKLTK